MVDNEEKKTLLVYTYTHIHSSEEREKKDTYTPKDVTVPLFKIDDWVFLAPVATTNILFSYPLAAHCRQAIRKKEGKEK